MRYELKDGLPDEFVYAASVKVPYRAAFEREEDGIGNVLSAPPKGWDDYRYISAVLNKPVKLPAEIELETKFDAFGAPLVIFSESLDHLEDGRLQYGTHYEAVLYEQGINFWRIVPGGEKGQQVDNLCRAKQAMAAGEWTKLTVKITREGIEARANGLTAQAECLLPEQMYVGFTACEGDNHFRCFEVREI